MTGLSMAGELNTDITLIHIGAFSITQTQTALDLGISADLEPSIGMSNTLELRGYDPLQSGEPALAMTGGYSFELESATIFAALDATAGGGTGLSAWRHPFGFQGAEVRRLAFQIGATYLPPYVDNLGFILDLEWDQYNIDLGVAIDTNDPEKFGFTLTINEEINVVRMWAQMQAMVYGPEAQRLFYLVKNLFNYIPFTIVSIDSNHDGALDPFIAFVPFPTSIAGMSLPDGMHVNGRVELAGQTGELALNTDADFTAMSGSLRIENLVLGNWLVISGMNPGSDLTASFEVSSDNLYFHGDGKIVVFGQLLAQAGFSFTATQLTISDAILPLAGALSAPVLSLHIDYLNASLNTLSASGVTSIVLFGHEVAGLAFNMNDQQIAAHGYMDLGGLSIDGNFVWNNVSDTLNIAGTLKINNVALASATAVFDGNTLLISGTLAMNITSVGGVDASITAKFNSNGLSVRAGADLGALGHPTVAIAANDFSVANVASQLYNQAVSDMGAVPQYIASSVTDGVTDLFHAGAYAFSSSQVDNTIRNALNTVGGAIRNLFGGSGERNQTYIDSQNISHGWIGNGGNDVAFGNGGDDNPMRGHQGNDLIDGGAGNDWMEGGSGSDLLYGGDGDDHVEGHSGVDIIYGGFGNDAIYGNGPSEVPDSGNELHGGAGDDLVYGAGANDIAWGDGGNDYLSGTRPGISDGIYDGLYGGTGDDIYSMSDPLDGVFESADEGWDAVHAAFDYALPDNVESLTLYGTAASGTGNSLNNTFAGNAVNNTFNGGLGDDTYFLDSLDTALEPANAGTDTVITPVSFTLPANVENLTLTGTAAINGNGNGLDNVLAGNEATNTLTGGAGNDSYYVDSLDTVVEAVNGGTDTIYSATHYDLRSANSRNVENLTLIGGESQTAVGDSGANVLIGNWGDNILDGTQGADTLTGGLGDDKFRLYGGDIGSVRTITDFSVAGDTIELARGIFSKLTAAASVNPENFAIGTEAQDGNDYLIYNPGNGALYYDTDGSGAAAPTQIVQLGVGLPLTNADFAVIFV